MHLGGNYDTAVNICIDYLENVPLEKRISDEQCIKMSVRQIHHSMFYKPVDPLIADAKELIINTKAEDYPEIYNELLFLIGGNLGILSGNFEEAEKWREKEKNNKAIANISYAIRKSMDDIYYLDMKYLSNFIDKARDKNKDLALSRSSDMYKPVRDAVGHTSIITEPAKKQLSVELENIKSRVMNLMDEIKK